MVNNLNVVITARIKKQITIGNYFDKYIFRQIRKDYYYYVDNESSVVFYLPRKNITISGFSKYHSRLNKAAYGYYILTPELLLKYSICDKWVHRCNSKYLYRFCLNFHKILLSEKARLSNEIKLCDCTYIAGFIMTKITGSTYFKKYSTKKHIFNIPFLKQINEVTSIKK